MKFISILLTLILSVVSLSSFADPNINLVGSTGFKNVDKFIDHNGNPICENCKHTSDEPLKQESWDYLLADSPAGTAPTRSEGSQPGTR